MRGFSKIIEEAIDLYVKEKAAKDNAVQELLKLKGAWSAEEGARMRAKLKEFRENWRI
jgi:hypothetical protein